MGVCSSLFRSKSVFMGCPPSLHDADFIKLMKLLNEKSIKVPRGMNRIERRDWARNEVRK